MTILPVEQGRFSQPESNQYMDIMPLDLTPELFALAFPFHLVLDRELCIVQIGSMLQRIYPDVILGRSLTDYFIIRHPHSTLTYPAMVQHANAQFVLEA